MKIPHLLFVCAVITAPDGVPQSLTQYGSYPTSLKLQWSLPEPEHQNGDITGYHVSWRILVKSSSKAAVLIGKRNVTSTTITINKLLISSSYQVSVAAYNKAGIGPSANITVRTTDSKLKSRFFEVFTVR